jgi:hypothetical protein
MQPDVLGNATRSIGGSRTITAGSSGAENVTKDHSMKIGGSHTRTMGSSDTTNVNENLSEKVGAVLLEGSAKTNTFVGEKTNLLTVGGALLEVVKGNKMAGSGVGRTQVVGGLTYEKSDKIMATRVEKLRDTWIGGKMSVKSVKSLLIAGLEKLSKRAKSASYEGTGEVVLQVKDTQVVMKDGVIGMEAVSSITIETSAKNAQASTTSTQI